MEVRNAANTMLQTGLQVKSCTASSFPRFYLHFLFHFHLHALDLAFLACCISNLHFFLPFLLHFSLYLLLHFIMHYLLHLKFHILHIFSISFLIYIYLWKRYAKYEICLLHYLIKCKRRYKLKCKRHFPLHLFTFLQHIFTVSFTRFNWKLKVPSFSFHYLFHFC